MISQRPPLITQTRRASQRSQYGITDSEIPDATGTTDIPAIPADGIDDAREITRNSPGEPGAFLAEPAFRIDKTTKEPNNPETRIPAERLRVHRVEPYRSDNDADLAGAWSRLGNLGHLQDARTAELTVLNRSTHRIPPHLYDHRDDGAVSRAHARCKRHRQLL